MRRPCWCTKQWQNVAQVLHNNRIKVPKDFFRWFFFWLVFTKTGHTCTYITYLDVEELWAKLLPCWKLFRPPIATLLHDPPPNNNCPHNDINSNGEQTIRYISTWETGCETHTEVRLQGIQREKWKQTLYEKPSAFWQITRISLRILRFFAVFVFVWAMNKYCTVAVCCSGSKKRSGLNYCCFPVSPWEVLRKRAGKKVKRLIDPRICLLHFKKTDIAISISGGKNIPSGSYSTIL